MRVALDATDHFIALLDRMDGDPDLEGGDAEQNPSAPKGHACQIVWLRGTTRDLEINSQPESRLPERDVSEDGAAEAGVPVSEADRCGGSAA